METRVFLQQLLEKLSEMREIIEAIDGNCIEMAVFPPFVSLPVAANLLLERANLIHLGAQNAHWEPRGAFTGEISANMLEEIGCRYVLIGHSERRHLFHEENHWMKLKVRAVLESGMIPLLCVGETLEEREKDQTFQIIEEQLLLALAGLSPDSVGAMVIAYEPVWAIGTGRTASENDAQEVCQYLRRLVAERFGDEAADGVRILYGGSVKASNTKGLISQPDIDGLLIGGASLEVESYLAIVREAL